YQRLHAGARSSGKKREHIDSIPAHSASEYTSEAQFEKSGRSPPQEQLRQSSSQRSSSSRANTPLLKHQSFRSRLMRGPALKQQLQTNSSPQNIAGKRNSAV